MSACVSVINHTVKCDLITYASAGCVCDNAHMSKSAEIARIHARIQQAMERKKIRPKPLSISAGLGETAVRDLLLGDDVRISTLRKLAGALDLYLEDLIGYESVPLTGRIGAGGTLIFEENGSFEFVVRPPGLTGDIEALEVIGDSMLPRYSSGDVVYIQRTIDGVLPNYIGEFCAVRLTTGETYLKLLARGSQTNSFTLISLNSADIEDVRLEWATPILFVLPSFARKNLLVI